MVDFKGATKSVLKRLFESSTKYKVDLCMSLLVFTLLMISVTTNGWHVWDTGYAGLWTTCSKTDNVACCTRIKNTGDVPAYIGATRAFIIMAILVITVELVYLFSQLRKDKSNNSDTDLINGVVCCCFSFTAVLFLLIAISVYGAMETESYIPDGASLSWSFVFSIVAMFLVALVKPIVMGFAS